MKLQKVYLNPNLLSAKETFIQSLWNTNSMYCDLLYAFVISHYTEKLLTTARADVERAGVEVSDLWAAASSELQKGKAETPW